MRLPWQTMASWRVPRVGLKKRRMMRSSRALPSARFSGGIRMPETAVGSISRKRRCCLGTSSRSVLVTMRAVWRARIQSLETTLAIGRRASSRARYRLTFAELRQVAIDRLVLSVTDEMEVAPFGAGFVG
jgi:hypothetical protein